MIKMHVLPHFVRGKCPFCYYENDFDVEIGEFEDVCNHFIDFNGDEFIFSMDGKE